MIHFERVCDKLANNHLPVHLMGDNTVNFDINICIICKKKVWQYKCACCTNKICDSCSDVWIKPEINAFQDNISITEILCTYCNKDHLDSFWK
jgi:hypothetical protein